MGGEWCSRGIQPSSTHPCPHIPCPPPPRCMLGYTHIVPRYMLGYTLHLWREWLTNRYKNITFPPLRFAGGKKLIVIALSLNVQLAIRIRILNFQNNIPLNILENYALKNTWFGFFISRYSTRMYQPSRMYQNDTAIAQIYRHILWDEPVPSSVNRAPSLLEMSYWQQKHCNDSHYPTGLWNCAELNRKYQALNRKYQFELYVWPVGPPGFESNNQPL